MSIEQIKAEIGLCVMFNHLLNQTRKIDKEEIDKEDEDEDEVYEVYDVFLRHRKDEDDYDTENNISNLEFFNNCVFKNANYELEEEDYEFVFIEAK
ncbi:MAG: hypothetical protein ACRDAQ_10870 [Cetobacterium sp.]